MPDGVIMLAFTNNYTYTTQWRCTALLFNTQSKGVKLARSEGKNVGGARVVKTALGHPQPQRRLTTLKPELGAVTYTQSG